MNSEDFLAFVYPAMILLGVLLSLLPAYIASKKNKSFWLWWISTACVFTILLLVIIKAQAIALSVYLLGILPIASILALLPRSSHRKTFPTMANLWAKIKSTRLNSIHWCLFTLILAGILYYCLLPQGWYQLSDKEPYFILWTLIFLIACLEYMLFIFIFSGRRKEHVVKGFLWTFLLSAPILLRPSRAFFVLKISNSIDPRVDIASIIAKLISQPVAGVFILFGLCSVPAALIIALNEKYGVVNIVASTFRSDDYSPPYIQFSKIPAAPILLFCILYIIFFKVFFHPNEGWMFLLPLVWLCFGLPTLLLTLAGTILSSVVIRISINQKKNIYALGIFLCGLLAIWRGAELSLHRRDLVEILVFYGMGSGLAALILWVISDYRGQSKIDGV